MFSAADAATQDFYLDGIKSSQNYSKIRKAISELEKLDSFEPLSPSAPTAELDTP